MVALGAVPFCQTNVPQTMCTIQCSNPLYGETGNPWDKRRECGGSSGGEGCLIGAGASVLGLGSDYGGSVRSPAALCGICSLRSGNIPDLIATVILDLQISTKQGSANCGS